MPAFHLLPPSLRHLRSRWSTPKPANPRFPETPTALWAAGRRRWKVLLALSLVLACAIGTAVSPVRAEPPAPVARPALAMLMPVDPSLSQGRDLAPSWTDPFCGDCHKVEPLLSHPLGVAPSMAVPAHLPLADGVMACTTCHLDSVEAHTFARISHNPMLRDAEDGAMLCTRCHDQSALTRTSQHALAVGRAHLKPGRSRHADSRSAQSLQTLQSAEASEPVRFKSVDALDTQFCLSCHDGLMSADSGAELGGGSSVLGALGPHPVGVDYPRASAPGTNDWSLRPRNLLDARIRLEDGQVGCTSCHSLFSTRKNLLVMSNRSSALCMSCHEQR